MGNSISYSKYSQECSLNYNVVSYNQLTKNTKPNQKISLRGLDIYRLIKPYISVRFMDQVTALLPLVAYLILFQLFVLHQSIIDAMSITGGMMAVVLGLMFFMEGIKQGLMPLGEMMGSTLPKKIALVWVLFIAFLLGVAVTFAEPAIGALKAAGAFVPYQNPDGSIADSIYLYALLNIYTSTLVLLVGVGVGMAAVLGTIRFVKGWSLKPYIYISIAPVVALTLYCMSVPKLAAILGLAWDSGAVTTGPVTVPLVLALGMVLPIVLEKVAENLWVLVLLHLASLFPIMVVLLACNIFYIIQ